MTENSSNVQKPLIPAKTADEEEKNVSDISSDNSRDDEIKRDRPPHYE
jgi:hypothetical protein